MTQREATTHKRINITLPASTIRLVDTLVEKGDRSKLLNEAVHFYVKQVSRMHIRKQLQLGAIARASRDRSLTEDWFLLDEEPWSKKKST